MDNDGFVKDSHGVSVFDNADSVKSKGFELNQIDNSTVPDTLEIEQRGNDPTHFEIRPKKNGTLTPEQFKADCNKIKCIK